MSLCVTPYWLLGGPTAFGRGVLPFQPRRELGLLLGSTPAESVIYYPQRARRDWQCFLQKPLHLLGETTNSPTQSTRFLPMHPKQNHLEKHRALQESSKSQKVLCAFCQLIEIKAQLDNIWNNFILQIKLNQDGQVFAKRYRWCNDLMFKAVVL